MPPLRTILLIAAGAVASASVMILWVTLQAPDYQLRGPLDLFGLATGSPFIFVFPLIASLTGASRPITRLRHRGVSLWWTRTRVGGAFWRESLIAGGLVGAAHALAIALTFAWSTMILPELQHTRFDPAGYGLLTTEAVITDIAARSNFGELAAISPWAFGLVWSVLIGLEASCYCLLSIGIAALSDRPLLALFVPFIGYHVETIAAALASEPNLGLMYTLTPFGLVPAPAFVPIALVAGLTVCALLTVGIPAARPTAFRALR